VHACQRFESRLSHANSLHSFSSFRSQLNDTISLPKYVSRKTHALHTVDAIHVTFPVSNNGFSKQKLISIIGMQQAKVLGGYTKESLEINLKKS
jgi:hypothetical protein